MKKIFLIFSCLCFFFIFSFYYICKHREKYLLEVAHCKYNEQSFDEAFRLYLELAKKGLPEAQFYVGRMYLSGIGTNQDTIAAYEWFAKSAKCGVASASYNMGIMRLEGIGVKKDDMMAILFFSSAAKKGLPEAQVKLFEYYYNKKDYHKAIPYLKDAVDQRFPNALFLMSLLALSGDGYDKNDEQAFTYMNMAYDNKFLLAYPLLAELYFSGIGTEKNLKSAVHILYESACLGECLSQVAIFVFLLLDESTDCEFWYDTIKKHIKGQEFCIEKPEIKFSIIDFPSLDNFKDAIAQLKDIKIDHLSCEQIGKMSDAKKIILYVVYRYLSPYLKSEKSTDEQVFEKIYSLHLSKYTPVLSENSPGENDGETINPKQTQDKIQIPTK